MSNDTSLLYGSDVDDLEIRVRSHLINLMRKATLIQVVGCFRSTCRVSADDDKAFVTMTFDGPFMYQAVMGESFDAQEKTGGCPLPEVTETDK